MTRRASGRMPAEFEPWHDPNVVLGSSGPQRVSSDDADPSYAPPPLLGFGTHRRADPAAERADQLRGAIDRALDRVAESAALAVTYGTRPPSRWLLMPRLWQDDGDQA